MRCRLLGSSFQNFTLKVRVVAAFDTAVIGFLGDDRLEISGSGHFRLYRGEPILGMGTFLYPPTGLAVGSAALHNTSLGVSERANDITLQILGQSYSIYANGQLLGTYLANVQESAGPIWLGTNRGQQAEFRDIAIYTPS
jgi:hypothetical protein